MAGLDSADAAGTCINQSLERRITHLIYTFASGTPFPADDVACICSGGGGATLCFGRDWQIALNITFLFALLLKRVYVFFYT